MDEQLYGEQLICPRCGSDWEPCVAICGSVPDKPVWFKCSNHNCNTYYNSYKPLIQQEAVHRDPHTIIGNFGGYGSAKTTTSRQEAYKHAILTPNGNTLITANVTSQYEQTIKREFEEDFPVDFVASINNMKSYIDLINGHRIMYRPLDDVDKMRSYNLSMFIIIEGSEVPPDAFTLLRTRLRNQAASVPLYDEAGRPKTTKINGVDIPVFSRGWRRGLVESNPANAWIKYDLVQVADTLKVFGDVMDTFTRAPEDKRDKNVACILTSSSANPYLPANYIAQISAGKPPWWVARYVNCSFSYSESRVYPNSEKTYINSFDVPKTWKRIIAHDWGLVDSSAFVQVAIDESMGRAYAYREKGATNKNVRALANIFKEETKDIPTGMWYTQPILDPVSGFNRNAEKMTLADLYAEHDLIFQPGQRNVPARIFRLNTYIETGSLFIFRDACPELCEELDKYMFAPDKNALSGYKDVPVDKNNHFINCLEWIVMELPENPHFIMKNGVYQNGVQLNAAQAYNDDYGSVALVNFDNLEYSQQDINEYTLDF